MVFFIHNIVMKSPSILFLFVLNLVYAYPGDLSISHGSWWKLGKHRCPAENALDIAHIEEASKNHYQVKYCLFEKESQQPQDKHCKQEINFLFDEMIGKEAGICGPTSYQTKHAFSYYNCGDQSDLEKYRDENFQKKPVTKTYFRWFTYQVCYDTAEKKVLWTMHNIGLPHLLLKQKPFKLPAISTDPYFMSPNLFTTLETRYELEKKKNLSVPETFIMIPQPLAPPEHFPVHLTKKSTNHYINMAPLWEYLIPVMKTINQGLIQVQEKLRVESQNPESYDNLIILTKVEPSENVDTTSETWFNLLLFQGNIWYKLIYQENKQAAVMIIIHNTPGKPPAIGCLVGRQKKCEFEKWSKDNSVSPNYTMYAYCCRVTAGNIRQVFSRNYEIDEYLEIHDLVTNDKSPESKV